MRPRVIALPGVEAIAEAIARRLRAAVDDVELRAFPDRESYVRIDGDVAGRDVVLVCTLDRPNEKLVPLHLLAATARDLGARRVGLVAPYLAYMRQDAQFRPGEGVTSGYFADLVSNAVDWLVTVDPHLHRRSSLQEIYRIPARALHAAPVIASWLRTHVPDALLIGPDVESRQWVQAIAELADVPAIVLEKARHGPLEVEIRMPAGELPTGRTPVLLDDILSTGSTMRSAVALLRRAGASAPVCVAVHAVCADQADARLLADGAARVVTCNTIAHPSNGIDVAPLVADGVAALLEERTVPEERRARP
jgi:ribose-phosphate pyrophosphokinase